MPTLTREPDNALADQVVADPPDPRPKRHRSTTQQPAPTARRRPGPRTRLSKAEVLRIRQALAEQREQRWLKRCARLDADTALDPYLRDIYKLRTICDNTLACKVLDLSPQRVSYLRLQPLPPGFDDSLPGFFPTPDTIVAVRGGTPDYGTELGRLLEWAEWDGRLVFNHPLGAFDIDPKAGARHGRPPRDG